MLLKVTIFLLFVFLARQIFKNLMQNGLKPGEKTVKSTSKENATIPEKDIIEGDFREVSDF